jgi:hypothetical protein
VKETTQECPPILKAYEKLLEGRVERKEIKSNSKQVYMNNANCLFECCLRSLTKEALEAITKSWFPGHNYGFVIDQLKGLIEQRPRPKLRVKSG